MFEMPKPTWGIHRTACARDAAVEDDIALQTMEAKHVYKGYLPERHDQKNGESTSEPTPKHGQLMKLRRWAPGMGHSNRPHLALSLNGTPNGPAGYGGGGVWPPVDFEYSISEECMEALEQSHLKVLYIYVLVNFSCRVAMARKPSSCMWHCHFRVMCKCVSAGSWGRELGQQCCLLLVYATGSCRVALMLPGLSATVAHKYSFWTWHKYTFIPEVPLAFAPVLGPQALLPMHP